MVSQFTQQNLYAKVEPHKDDPGTRKARGALQVHALGFREKWSRQNASGLQRGGSTNLGTLAMRQCPGADPFTHAA